MTFACIYNSKIIVVQSAGAVEYTDGISAEDFDIKQSEGETLALEI